MLCKVSAGRTGPRGGNCSRSGFRLLSWQRRFFVEDWAGETFTTLSQLSISTSPALAASKLTCQHPRQASMYRYMCLVGGDEEDTLLNDRTNDMAVKMTSGRWAKADIPVGPSPRPRDPCSHHKRSAPWRQVIDGRTTKQREQRGERPSRSPPNACWKPR